MAIELGPILRFESRLVARRKSGYAVRMAFGLALLALLATYHWAFGENVQRGDSPSRVKDFLSGTITAALLGLHFVTALLIAPIAAADGFSRERIRTMMPTLLVTDLTVRRIVFETFAARLVPGIWLWLCLLPITLFTIPWCGVDPKFVGVMEGVIFGSTVVGVATTLALSLWSGQTFVALMGAYVLWGGLLFNWMIAWGFAPPGSWTASASPFFLLISRWNRSPVPGWTDAGLFMGLAFGATTILLVLTAVTLRPVMRSSLHRTTRRIRRLEALQSAWQCWFQRLPGPTLDGNPVLWRAWWRGRTLWGGRIFWVLYVLAACLGTVICVHEFWGGQIRGPDLVGLTGYEVAIGLLAVAVRAGVSWSEEKSDGREGMDVLLATPLTAKAIVMGKWWGAFRAVPLVALLPFLSAVILAAGASLLPQFPGGVQIPEDPVYWRLLERAIVPVIVLGQVVLYGAFFVSVGVLLATRCRRPSRAVFATVVIYVMIALFVPAASESFLLSSNRTLAEGLGAVSPIGGPIVTLMSMFSSPYFSTTRQILPYALIWLFLTGIGAWTITWWTICRFDRWAGRAE
jgi:ABC-type transport system involved in multi-copper enzyme maturation permease subunit